MLTFARVLTYGIPFVVVAAVQKVHAAWVATPTYDLFPSGYFAWGVLYAAILSLAAYSTGLPDVPVERGRSLGTSLTVSVVAAGVMSVLQLLWGQPLVGRFVIFASAAVAVPLQVAITYLATSGRTRAGARDRVLFVGGGEEAVQLASDLGLAPERTATLVGRLEVHEAGAVGGEEPLVAAVAACDATVLVLDRSAVHVESIIDQAALLHVKGLRVRTLVEFYGEWLAKLPLNELERVSLFFDISEVHQVQYGRTKRIIDILCAVLGIVPLLLAVPVVIVGNLVANRGPLFFSQERVGRGGTTFRILKFRTMLPTTSAAGAGEWTAADDPRITRFGRFLRITHVDELPQVINILRGELSVVGPRPEQPHYVEQLNEKLRFYDMRHLVRPGLTGWAQVKYGYAADERDALQKLQYEFFYLRHQSVLFDLRIMLRTIRSTIGGEGKGR